MIHALILLASSALPGVVDDPPTPTEKQVQAAKEFLKGTWDLVKFSEGGELIGPELIRRKVAANGKVAIDTLTIHFTSPDSGDEKVLAYRLNPAAEPKQLDIINAASLTYRGIYRFEGDQLAVCFNHDEKGARPTEFSSPPASSIVLLTLKLADPSPGPDVAPPVKVASQVVPARDPEPADLFAAAPAEVHKVVEVNPVNAKADNPQSIRIEGPKGDVRVVSEIAIPTPAARTPTPSELQRAHDLLTGKWDIVSVTDNGERLGSELVRRRLARDGQLAIGSRVVQIVSPESGVKRVSAYRINPAAEPRQFDLTTEFDSVKKGIYRFDGEELIVCLNEDPDDARPETFDASQGSNRRLIRLHLSEPEPPPTHYEPLPPRAPTPEELAREREDKVRSMLVGSWTNSDSKGSVTTVLRPDGTFTTTRKWSKAIKRLFEGQTSSASGRWSYANGLLRATVLSTSERSMAGQSFYGRVQSIGESTMVAEDGLGNLKSYRKLQ